MENVLTVRRQLIEKFLPEKGVTGRGCREVVDIILKEHQFTPRPQAEEDAVLKQIIPYVVLCRGQELFVTRRLKKGGEARLHGLLSIGVGGHINPEADGDGSDVLTRGMLREINEEVTIENRGALTLLGMINDDTNDVGRVHLGLCYTLEVSGQVSVNETEKLEGFWLTRNALAERKDELETWTALVLSIL